MKAVFLDADSLGADIDLEPIAREVDSLQLYGTTAPEQLAQRIEGMDLLITNKVKIPDWAIQGRKGILVVATGLNNVDTAAAATLGVPVHNVLNYGTDAVAQHTLMLMLALAGRLPVYQHKLAQGEWQQSPFFCLLSPSTTQLSGKHLVIVGSGTLGQAVARLAEAFGARVSFAARPGNPDDSRPTLEQLLPTADVVSLHCPLTSDTHHLINAERLQLIKPGCLLVNCARGGVIDEAACLAALQEGQLGGLAVDVLPEEPPRNGHPLLEQLEGELNLLVTPHNAWITPEARQNIVRLTVENIRQLKGGF
ncbi:D-2-hydroxyacid dehydrogenase [Oceanobacter mangrovi]|uniref:D-2-hydroxyacid dehydrogenase n=1 Tax=Oceanobacter mangrovi TaxID=2862510 RepID=UPI001C8E7318|nr:D-2-hydroxyacid dehydrogenase [Oceanobacter mangrovi]